mgnify:FL=1|jgi:hypothetical protein
MKYIYNFKDKTDIIDSGILRRDSYGLFTSEIIELNKQFNYSVYLFGSYIGYLINGDKYNDIDFILTSEKILELNELIQFFKSFHDICKKYNVGYNLMYSTDKNEGDFDLDVYNGSIFNTGSSKVIRLYKRIDVNNKLGFEFKPLIGTELYEGLMVPVNQKMAKKMQMGVKFYAPIKIQ